MKKIILSAIVCFGLGVNLANAEETNIPTLAAVFQMNTTDQASVAAAFGKFVDGFVLAAAVLFTIETILFTTETVLFTTKKGGLYTFEILFIR